MKILSIICRFPLNRVTGPPELNTHQSQPTFRLKDQAKFMTKKTDMKQPTSPADPLQPLESLLIMYLLLMSANLKDLSLPSNKRSLNLPRKNQFKNQFKPPLKLPCKPIKKLWIESLFQSLLKKNQPLPKPLFKLIEKSLPKLLVLLRKKLFLNPLLKANLMNCCKNLKILNTNCSNN